MPKILVVDDEQDYLESLKEILENNGYLVDSSTSFDQTMEKIKLEKPDLIALDLDLNDGKEISGLHILNAVRKKWNKEELPVLIISGTGNIEKYFNTMESGANDYLKKPLDFEILPEILDRLIHPESIREKKQISVNIGKLVGSSKLMMNMAQSIYQAAQLECDALIIGETGTGKSMVANTFHQQSKRSNKPLVKIDCPTIPNELFESEIFGYLKGSFTHAERHKPGRLESADGGIVFFDEIGDLPLQQQAKLLNVLETKSFMPIGATEAKQVDVIVLAATNRDLYSMVQQGVFRKDLYYRLMNKVLVIPPLREHAEDIPELVEHYSAVFNAQFEKNIQSVDSEVITYMQQYPWEGNIRQLTKCVANGVMGSRDNTLKQEDVEPFLKEHTMSSVINAQVKLNASMLRMQHKEFKQEVLQKLEREYIVAKLEAHVWDKRETAKALGINNYQQLDQMMKRLEISRDEV
jgi:DNA-binding NtrC family response regulator